MAKIKRTPNVFEAILLVIGVSLIVLGYLAIHNMVIVEKALSWDMLQTTFMWLLMVLVIIVAAVNENMKEELKIVIQNQLEEMRLLRKDLMKKR